MTGVLLALLILAVAGLPLAAWLEPSFGWRARLGAGFMLGAGVATLVMLFATLGGVPWSLPLVAGAIAFVAVAALVPALRQPRRARAVPRVTPLSAAADAGTIVSLCGYTLFATLAPPWEWDFWAMWGLKAKEFFLARGVSFAYLSNPDNVFSHPDYPPLAPLTFDLAALLQGRWDDRWMGLVSVAFAMALLLVAREELERRSGSASVGALGTLALSGIACSPWVGLAEAPFVAAAGAGALVVSRGLAADETRAVVAGGLLVGVAALTKNEGTSLALAVAAATLVVAPRRLAVVVAATLAPLLPWAVAIRLAGVKSELFEGSFAGRVAERLSSPTEFFGTIAGGQIERWEIWLALAVVLVLSPATARRERFMLLVVALQSLACLAIYAGTSHDFASHVQGSLGRVSTQLAPFVAFVAILGADELVRRGRGAGEDEENECERTG